MDIKNVNYAIEYIKKNYPHAEINQTNIGYVRSDTDFQLYLKRKLETKENETKRYTPVFEATTYRIKRPSFECYIDDEDIEITWQPPL